MVVGGIPIAREAIPFVVPLLGLGLIFLFLKILPGTVLSFLLVGFVLFFFRDPEREVPKGEGLVVAPADGTVVVVEPYKGTEAQGEELLQVSIFLSLLDVHINRAPVSGLVEEVRYTPGRFKVAYVPEASLENERNLIRFASWGGTVWMKQIAGYLARRIVCRVKPGQRVEAGERIGLIRFGSRVDLLLPGRVATKVRVGDRVKGGTTVIAILPGRKDRREGERFT
ncbi:MAG: phosphatidylserine decarboxylase family protein [candidate division NC10 bacterium]|nr:phosphatidylserine decarboxylase family protein [candidate division NC10 bacterium]